ncbi:MAG: M23 family metallopeptidase [Spirochaetales bacterium]|nr:M23 family metallopeptidase [Spirochaetales bacterium]MCF7939114.1 M23 family metallopeptidase [Spirochaetales bacterium]
MMLRSLCSIFILLLLLPAMSFGQEEVHVLEEGETLYRIARLYNVPVDSLMEANNIEDATRLRVGMEIVIPSENEPFTGRYTVERGDTLYSIARRFDVDLETLCSRNNIDSEKPIFAGMKISVPSEENGVSETKTQVAEETSSTYQETADPQSTQDRAEKREQEIVEQEGGDGKWPVPGSLRPLEGKIRGVLITSEPGQLVRAVHPGEVVWAGPYRGFGKVVFVESAEGFLYVYGGNADLKVRVGDQVKSGTELGILGSVPGMEGPEMVFLVYRNGKPIDPISAPRG